MSGHASGVHRGAAQLPPRAEWAARLAGLFAEFGFTELTMTTPGAAPRRLASRETDLPGLLQRSIPCSLESSVPRAMSIAISDERVEWTTDDAELASALGSAFK